jgi:hypothetical protein
MRRSSSLPETPSPSLLEHLLLEPIESAGNMKQPLRARTVLLSVLPLLLHLSGGRPINQPRHMSQLI